MEGFIAHKLMASQRIEDGGTHTTPGDDWRHKAVQLANIVVFSILWPHVFKQALPRLDEQELLSEEIFNRPFARRGFGPEEEAFISEAAQALARGSYVAAAQLWILLAERLLRLMLRAFKKPTLTVKQEGESHALFETVMERYHAYVATIDTEYAERSSNLINAFLAWKGFSTTNWRNRVAHGLVSAAEMNRCTAYVAFFLCVIAVFPLKAKDEEERETQSG